MTAPTRRRPAPGSVRLTAVGTGRGTSRRRGGWWLNRNSRGGRFGRRTGAGASLLAAVAFATFLALSSGVLAVTRVSVVGTQRLSVSEVLTAARVHSGSPMARLPVAEIRRRVGALPVVAGVDGVVVTRHWPHSVVISVRERLAVAALAQSTESWQLVDGTGQPFAAEAAAPAGLPRLQVSSPGSGDPATQAAVAVVVALPPALRALVVQVSAATPETVTLSLTDGRTVVWGSPGQTAEKAAAVAAILPRPQKHIDVSAATVVVVK